MIGGEEFTHEQAAELVEYHEQCTHHIGTIRQKACSLCGEPVYLYCGAASLAEPPCDWRVELKMSVPHGLPGTPTPHGHRRAP